LHGSNWRSIERPTLRGVVRVAPPKPGKPTGPWRALPGVLDHPFRGWNYGAN
jgi:hypothetical protein